MKSWVAFQVMLLTETYTAGEVMILLTMVSQPHAATTVTTATLK